jgi:predicted enzyme related to lactoylglutathione lyase
MRHVTPHRLAAFVAALSAFALPVVYGQAPSESTDLPALNQQASSNHLPGKFVWADLFTHDAAGEAKFYSSLFGWTPHSMQRNGRTHIVMSNGGQPIASIVERKAAHADALANWIPFIAVPDAAAALAAANDAGGKTLAPARDFPRMGMRAIIGDPEGTPIGIIQSSSGDPADYPSKDGDWAWFELYSKNPKAAGDFYGRVFHYDVKADSRLNKEGHYILATGQNHRGGIQSLDNTPGAEADWIPTVQVPDIDAAIAHASTLGGQVVFQPSRPELASRFAIISDPDGGVIGLVQFVDDVNPATAAPGTTPNRQ